ncbi:MAG: phosphohistidine phosphatase SixA [Thermodesulfobacteriaceae bacterium]|nr:phosphohistidine phosphatase SixA [Thermodesulfobacteriaceae bacterium]MCX8042096.1 phosphohistidine phosphatase SixA [Thermodesulfobacteriaceae bacterium]MDW8136484.1 phosphohistidine phosphatase SixA [Thermodesulfobacterium sp.]
MYLYLVQHGIPKSEKEDPTRPLSEKGKQEVEKVGQVLSKLNLKIYQIFHSGKLRAIQTAEILEKYLKPERGRSESEALNPLDDVSLWFTRIEKLEVPIMLVGHLPHLAKLVSMLLTGVPDKEVINFRQGAVICLERKNLKWGINWIITPEIAETFIS